MRFWEMMLAEIFRLFHRNFVPIFPPATRSSAATTWLSVQVGELYVDETGKIAPIILTLLGKDMLHAVSDFNCVMVKITRKILTVVGANLARKARDCEIPTFL